MKIAILLAFLFSIFSCNWACSASQRSFVVNIFSENNGAGLQKDREILKKELIKLGHTVYEKNCNIKPSNNELSADINIFFEELNLAWYSRAKRNWFIPNPDYYSQGIDLLDEIDLIVCRTHESERIFQNLHKETYYLGFTSHDSFANSIKKKSYYLGVDVPLINSPNSMIKKDYSKCLHLAGMSTLKGTTAVVKAWQDFPFLPHLSVVIRIPIQPLIQDNVVWYQKRLQDEPLRFLQNNCGIHLCPSEIEGFGHYIVEAMSTEAVVITTDAPPMNEFITDKRCLVPYESMSPCRLGISYYVSSEELARTVQRIMGLPEQERREIGKNNREVYLQKTKEFHQNLEILMNTI